MTGFHGTRVRADLFAGWFGRGGSRPGSLPVLGTAPQGKENIPVNTRDKARNPLAVRYPSGGFMAGHFGHDLGLTVHPISSSGRLLLHGPQADWEKQSPTACQKTSPGKRPAKRP
jgi:hypothetical protein